jgi:hypothetical protein
VSDVLFVVLAALRETSAMSGIFQAIASLRRFALLLFRTFADETIIHVIASSLERLGMSPERRMPIHLEVLPQAKHQRVRFLVASSPLHTTA